MDGMGCAYSISSIACVLYEDYQDRSGSTGRSGNCYGKYQYITCSTLAETVKVMEKVKDILKNTPEVENYSATSGYGLISGQGTSYASCIVDLKPWDERK